MKKLTYAFCFCLAVVTGATSCNNSSQTGDAAAKDSPSVKTDSPSVAANWKIGVQLWTFHFVPFVQALDKADSAGVKNLEAFPGQDLGGGMKGKFGLDMTAQEKQTIKDLLSKKGMHINAMGVIVPKDLAEWKKYFELAKEFDMGYITCEPLKNQWDGIDSLAGVYGIKVAIHDHPKPNAYWHPDSVLAAVKGHNNIGSCADVGHWARNGLNPVECLQKLEGHIYGVHLKDIDSLGNTHANDLVVGTGKIDFPAIFKELARQKFNTGQFSIERENNWYNNVPDVVATVKYFKEQTSKL